VTFIESKDECEVPFRPGVTQGLDDESIDPWDPVSVAPSQATKSSLNPTPNPNLGISTAPPIQTPTTLTSTIPPIPPTFSSSHIQRSSWIPKPSTHSAEASGIDQLSAVQCATAESIASKNHLDDKRHAQHQSRTTSSVNPSPAPPDPNKLIEITYKAANELSEAQTANVLEQVYGDGFEWGLPADVNVTCSSEEPCSLDEALASLDAPKWLAACREELGSIRDLKVFQLVPHDAATGRTIMDHKFVFRLKRDQHGNPVRWKAQSVVKGYSVIYGIA
jgi:hypothetical protein